MGKCPVCGRSTYHSHRQPDERDAYFRAIMGAYTVRGERIMAGTIQTCAHIKQGAPIAGQFTIPANVPNRNGEQFAEPMTVQVCETCIAAGTSGPSQIGKSIGADYFGSKLG